MLNAEIQGRPVFTWLLLFEQCYEWRWETNKMARWHRTCWPENGGALEQSAIIIEILQVINSEYQRMMLERVR